MNKTHFLKHSKLTLVSASLLLILAACGGGGSSSDTAPAETTNEDATATNTPAPAPSATAKCSVNRVVLSPASGTISKSQTSLRATIDFEAFPGEDIRIYAYIASKDNDDFIESDKPNIGKINNGRGQVLLSFDLKNHQGFYDAADPDHYTELRVYLNHSKGSCSLDQSTDFFLIK